MERAFKIIPGLLLWLVLLAPVYLSYITPNFYGFLVIVLALYWLYRAIVFTIGLTIGYYRYSKSLNTNWLNECINLNKKLPKHLIVIPVGSAKYKTLKHTLDAISNQNYPKELIYISLSFEKRLILEDKIYYEKLKKRIRKEYKHFGNRLMVLEHPDNLENEVVGAAANRSWGNRKAAEILEDKGERLSDFITTSPDEDIRFHSEYLAALTHRYLSSSNNHNKFYQTAVYLFTNNYWQVPTLIRTWSMSISLPVLASSVTHRTWRETWSCYSINLDVLKKVDYWDTSIGIDDTPFFWRPFNHFNGQFECEVFYIPLYADAVYHPSKIENYRAQFKQLVRWGWGVVAFPIAMKIFLKNNKISFYRKLKKLAIMLELIILMKISTVVFTFSIPLLHFFHKGESEVNIFLISYLLSAIMQIITLLMIPMLYFKFKLLPIYQNGSPNYGNKIRQIFDFLIEIPLHFFILYTYALIPFLIGPTLMMLGFDHKYKVVTKF